MILNYTLIVLVARYRSNEFRQLKVFVGFWLAIEILYAVFYSFSCDFISLWYKRFFPLPFSPSTGLWTFRHRSHCEIISCLTAHFDSSSCNPQHVSRCIKNALNAMVNRLVQVRVRVDRHVLFIVQARYIYIYIYIYRYRKHCVSSNIWEEWDSWTIASSAELLDYLLFIIPIKLLNNNLSSSRCFKLRDFYKLN